MIKTNEHKTTEKLAADLPTICDMLCVGRATAERIGTEAGAVVRLGRRKLYNVKKVQAYLDAVSSENPNE